MVDVALVVNAGANIDANVINSFAIKAVFSPSAVVFYVAIGLLQQ